MVIEVLLVEDSEADAALVEESLQDSKLKVKLRTVHDGVEALNYLNKEGKYQNVPTPDMIILDLNLPKKDGREVLEEIKVKRHNIEILKKQIPILKKRCEKLAKMLDIQIQK